ncbi:MAG: ribosome biogenesis GTPase YlqF [Acholeplasmatales bacterium]|nr:ribosome biogenesis GTPase YlqF [Acholeplasmatales bacterium]
MQIIQWFPGHMAKARREITESLAKVDIIFELYDARIPLSSKNPMVDEIVGKKPRLVLLNKASIADPKVTKEWIKYYKDKGIVALDIDSINGYNVNKIVSYAYEVLKDEFAKKEKRGIKSKTIKAMIIGIPNVGKSTLINRLAKRKAATTGDKPGVTKAQSWIKVTDDLFLLDTPGILWPKFEDQMVGVKLAMAGSIKDDILNLEQITLASIKYMKDNYASNLMDRYNITELEDDEKLILDQICKKRGCLLKGGLLDYDRASVMFMNDLRNTRIGAMSYERPADFEAENEEGASESL